MIEIKEPIIVIEDESDISKYDSLEFASSSLESYDINSYIVFDSKYRKLELYKKDKYNRVGFRLTDDESTYEDVLSIYLRKYYKNIKIDIGDDSKLEDLIENLKSVEWNIKNGNSILKDFFLWIKEKIKNR